MRPEKIVEALVEAAGAVGIRVRKERGNFRGGLCTVDGEEIIILNLRQPLHVQLAILAEGLHDRNVEDVFLAPAVRSALEDAWNNRVEADSGLDDAA